MLLTLLIASTLSAAAPGREPMALPTVTLNTVAVTTEGGVSPATVSASTRYCVVETLTGSHIPTKICHTADEWIAREGQVPTGRIARR